MFWKFLFYSFLNIYQNKYFKLYIICKNKWENKNFKEFSANSYTRVTRRKKYLFDLQYENKNKAFFKFQRSNYSSESCSEKIAYEISRVLGYDYTKIELGYDKKEKVGVLNYFFTDYQYYNDIALYLNILGTEISKEFYNLESIINSLNKTDEQLLKEFIKIWFLMLW